MRLKIGADLYEGSQKFVDDRLNLDAGNYGRTLTPLISLTDIP